MSRFRWISAKAGTQPATRIPPAGREECRHARPCTRNASGPPPAGGSTPASPTTAGASSNAPARNPAKARPGWCPASRTCIRTRSSARWPASPSGRPTRRIRSGPGARRCTASPRASTRTRCTRSPRSSTSEMLEAGYTTVCEFHYLHHSPDGRPYDRRGGDVARADRRRARNRHPPDAAAGAVHDRRLRRPRADRTAAALRPRRRRLRAPVRNAAARTRTTRCASASRCTACAPCRPMRCSRCSPHCRAIRPSTSTSPSKWPKSQDCLQVRGARPVEWLLANAPVDRNWTLVHATHLDAGGSARHCAGRRHRRDLPDDRSEPRRRPVPAARVPRSRRRLGHRLGFARVRLAGGGTALARIRAAADHAPSQHRGRHRDRTASANRCCMTCSRAARPSTGHAIGCFYNGAAADWVVLDRDASQFTGNQPAMRSTDGSSAGNRRAVPRSAASLAIDVVHEGRHRNREAISARSRRRCIRCWADRQLHARRGRLAP